MINSLIINITGIDASGLVFFAFLYVYIHQVNLAFETTTFVWVCPDILSHAQTFLDLLQIHLGSLGSIPR